ncbi:MAG TPA: glutathione S-transferase family protein [Rhizomicrobium sp.]|jgi:glutathione S-transferase|nr:glutathione S-transferase family protein [Rhizomicrobium sp.]
MTLTVYGSSLSPFVRKVRVMLAEKGLNYEHQQINPFAPPDWFLEISPLKRIPVLRDSDEPEPNTLADSSVICAYLEAKYPRPMLYPAAPFARARALWFEEYADTQMMQSIGPGLFFERVVKKLMGRECDETVVAATLGEKLPGIFDYLEAQVRGHEFLVADTFSIADIAIACMLVNFEHARERLDQGRWPELARYATAIHARPSFKASIDEERRFLERQRAA